MGDSSLTRRSLLLAAGTTALAGCSGTFGDSADSPDPISVYRLPDVPDEGESEPIVVDDLPINIERERLSQTGTRVTDLLETLPIPFGPADVPNGYVRRELVEAAEAATRHLDSARSAGNRFSALESLHRARTEARYAAEGWAFLDRDRTIADLRAERRDVIDEAETFRSNHEYRGDDPVRAVVVHGQLEERLRRIFDDPGPSDHGDSGALLGVAEWGEYTESARAHLTDGRYLYDRFTSSLGSDAGTVETPIGNAVESLTEELRRRRAALPSEPTGGDRDPAKRIRSRLRRRAESSAENVPSDPERPASAVLDAIGGLTSFHAYDRIQGRIENRDRLQPETGDDVRRIRSEAIDAIQAGLEESPRLTLVRAVLANAAMRVTHADDELSRFRSDVSPSRLNSPVRRYVTATVRARSAPAVCRRVLEALQP
jgi:hypothetical protein